MPRRSPPPSGGRSRWFPPLAPAPRVESTRLALVLFCAEQGFAGAFSERVLDAVGADLATSELFLIGTRGGAVAAERGIAADWKSAMPSHSPGVPKLADRIAEALYTRIATGEIDRLDAVFSRMAIRATASMSNAAACFRST